MNQGKNIKIGSLVKLLFFLKNRVNAKCQKSVGFLHSFLFAFFQSLTEVILRLGTNSKS